MQLRKTVPRAQQRQPQPHTALFRVFHRVGQQIGEDLLDADLVAAEAARQRRVQLRAEGQALPLGAKPLRRGLHLLDQAALLRFRPFALFSDIGDKT